MGAQDILTNIAILLVVATIWTDMKRRDKLPAGHRGRLITAALFAGISLVLHFLDRLKG
jgi:hypothetical protein